MPLTAYVLRILCTVDSFLSPVTAPAKFNPQFKPKFFPHTWLRAAHTPLVCLLGVKMCSDEDFGPSCDHYLSLGMSWAP